MVEKIIVSPESIRALGNIVMPKTGADFEEYNCTMEVSEDTVNGEDVTVYVLTPETTTISLVLSSNVSTVTAGGDVILSVTVTEDEVPVSGQSVSFKLGSTELGTSTTNSSGVATYTYTTTGSGSLNFSADYAGHSSNAVSVVVNKRSTSTSLSLGSASIVVGGSTSASATVTSTGSGVSGLTVTFYDGTTSLGTATTNGSGVATYTLSGLAVGSHSITAVVTATDTYDTSTSSASTLTVLDHSYSLAFSQASYVATGGSAALEMTLLDNGVPVEGATISVSGSDSSLYTGITDNSGVATVTVSVSAETTFTATYNNVSDTCIVEPQTHLYAPKLDGTETLYQIGGTTTVSNGEMSDGTCYLTQGWDNTIDWELSFEAYFDSSDGESIQLSFGNPTRADYNCIRFLCPAYNRIQTNKPSTVYNDGSLNSVTQSTWLSFNVKRVGSTMTVKIGNNNATTHTYRFSEYDTVCIGTNSWGNVAKLRNIVVDAL